MAKSRSTPTATTPGREPNPAVKYFQATRAELRKVTWPTQDETRNLTGIIVVVATFTAIFLGLLDYIFQIVVAGIIGVNFVWIGVAVVLFVGGAAAFYYNSQE